MFNTQADGRTTEDNRLAGFDFGEAQAGWRKIGPLPSTLGAHDITQAQASSLDEAR
jgi:hypothetical protein